MNLSPSLSSVKPRLMSLTTLGPTPGKNHVKYGRGSKKFSGPVKSIMQHYNFHPTCIKTILPSTVSSSDKSEDVSINVGKENLQEVSPSRVVQESLSSPPPQEEDEVLSLSTSNCSVVFIDDDNEEKYEYVEGDDDDDDDDDLDEDDESVYINCICNVNVTTDQMIIQCNFCGDGFHLTCCHLTEEVVISLNAFYFIIF